MKGRAAFSVIEAILTLFIFSLVLSALAYSLGQLSRVSLARQDFGLELEVVQLVQLVRDDARNAGQVDLGTGWIEFTGQNTNLALRTRLDEGLSSGPSLVTTRYQFTDGWLYRTRTEGSGDSQTAPMAQLAGFVIERNGRMGILKLSYEKTNKLENFEARVKLP